MLPSLIRVIHGFIVGDYPFGIWKESKILSFQQAPSRTRGWRYSQQTCKILSCYQKPPTPKRGAIKGRSLAPCRSALAALVASHAATPWEAQGPTHNALPTLWSQLKWGGGTQIYSLILGVTPSTRKIEQLWHAHAQDSWNLDWLCFFFQVLCFTQSLPQPQYSLLAWLSEIPAQINPRRCKQQMPKISSISRHRHGRLSRPIPEVRAGQNDRVCLLFPASLPCFCKFQIDSISAKTKWEDHCY